MRPPWARVEICFFFLLLVRPVSILLLVQPQELKMSSGGFSLPDGGHRILGMEKVISGPLSAPDSPLLDALSFLICTIALFF